MMKPIVDERNYTVLGIHSFRKANLTLEEAKQLATRMREQMELAGWAGKVRVLYRDGSEVK